MNGPVEYTREDITLAKRLGFIWAYTILGIAAARGDVIMLAKAAYPLPEPTHEVQR